jgi:hypothetical protein
VISNIIYYSIAGLAAVLFGVSSIRKSEPYPLAGVAFIAFLAGARLARQSDGPGMITWTLDIAALISGYALVILARRSIRGRS